MNAFETFLAARPFGFITDKDLPELIALHRLCQCLVRCGCCRFTCAAQNIAHLLKCIDAGGDYVRDVSVTSAELAAAPAWRPPPISPFVNLAAITAKVHAQMDNWQKKQNRRSASTAFDEADCGGAFDGSQVISDADPGL